MKKVFLLFLLTPIIFSGIERPAVSDDSLPPLQESEAYRRYASRTKVEFSKLLYLMDRLWGTPFKVVYDGTTYDTNFPKAKILIYFFQHYRMEKADQWIRTRTYRSVPENNIVYLKYPNGKLRPARDVLLEELDRLNQWEASRG